MHSKQVLKFRRQRKGKTDYRKRAALLRSNTPRAVIRKSINGITVQIAKYAREGDETVVGASAQELKKFGWKGNLGNLPAAYLVGYLCGLKAKKHKLGKTIVDIGRQSKQKGTRIFSALKGLMDAGLDINAKESVFPPEERIKGKHIESFAQKSEGKFSKKKDISKKISEHFEKVKRNMEGKFK